MSLHAIHFYQISDLVRRVLNNLINCLLNEKLSTVFMSFPGCKVYRVQSLLSRLVNMGPSLDKQFDRVNVSPHATPVQGCEVGLLVKTVQIDIVVKNQLQTLESRVFRDL